MLREVVDVLPEHLPAYNVRLPLHMFAAAPDGASSLLRLPYRCLTALEEKTQDGRHIKGDHVAG